MDIYNLEWKRSAQKELKKLNKSDIKNVIKNIEELTKEPFPTNSRKYLGTDYSYRLKIKNYRVIYSVYEEKLVIEIVKVGHRKDIYKK